MKIAECMNQPAEVIKPTETLQIAAQKMEELDCGVLPVAEDDQLVGVITDRDIAIRAIGRGRNADTPVSEVMSSDVLYCFSQADVAAVLENMGSVQVRRMPVVDAGKQLVGMVSLSDIAGQAAKQSGETLFAIAQPTGLHSQSL